MIIFNTHVWRNRPKTHDVLRASCDSTVTETDVQYPTDINLLLDDARRKIITLIMALCDSLGVKGWRKGIDNLKKAKKSISPSSAVKTIEFTR